MKKLYTSFEGPWRHTDASSLSVDINDFKNFFFPILDFGLMQTGASDGNFDKTIEFNATKARSAQDTPGEGSYYCVSAPSATFTKAQAKISIAAEAISRGFAASCFTAASILPAVAAIHVMAEASITNGALTDTYQLRINLPANKVELYETTSAQVVAQQPMGILLKDNSYYFTGMVIKDVDNGGGVEATVYANFNGFELEFRTRTGAYTVDVTATEIPSAVNFYGLPVETATEESRIDDFALNTVWGAEIVISSNSGTGAVIEPVFTAGALTSLVIHEGGTNYSATDTVEVKTSLGKAATVEINTVDGSGAITALTINTAGDSYDPDKDVDMPVAVRGFILSSNHIAGSPVDPWNFTDDRVTPSSPITTAEDALLDYTPETRAISKNIGDEILFEYNTSNPIDTLIPDWEDIKDEVIGFNSFLEGVRHVEAASLVVKHGSEEIPVQTTMSPEQKMVSSFQKASTATGYVKADVDTLTFGLKVNA